MRLSIDVESDALYLRMHERPVRGSRELADGTIVDLDDEGDLVGVEILAVSTGWDEQALLRSFTVPAHALQMLRVATHNPTYEVVYSSQRRAARADAGGNGGAQVVPEPVAV